MKVTAKGEMLTKTLKRCLLGGPGSNLNPVHQLLKLEAKLGKGGGPGTLSMTATTGLLHIDTSITALVEEPGIIAANGKDLANASGAMPLGETKLVSTGTKVQLVGSSGRRWSGSLGEPKAIGDTPEPKDMPWVGMPVATLRTVLERVSFTTADIGDNDKAVDGVLIRARPGQVTAVGTSHCMCVVLDQKADVGLKTPEWLALIPSLALPSLRDILDEADEEKEAKIDLYSDGRFMFIGGPSTLVVAAMPHGDYLPWELMLTGFPKESCCQIPRLALMESIKACQATSSRLDPGAIFELRESNVILTRTDPDNEYQDSVPASDMRPNLHVKFKCVLGYMLSCLKSADEDPELVFGPDGNGLLMQTKSGYRASIALMSL